MSQLFLSETKHLGLLWYSADVIQGMLSSILLRPDILIEMKIIIWVLGFYVTVVWQNKTQWLETPCEDTNSHVGYSVATEDLSDEANVRADIWYNDSYIKMQYNSWKYCSMSNIYFLFIGERQHRTRSQSYWWSLGRHRWSWRRRHFEQSYGWYKQQYRSI